MKKRIITIKMSLLLLVGLMAWYIPGIAFAYTTSRTINQTTDGQDMTFSFTSMPKATGNVRVTVTLYGDYDASSEYADIWIDNVQQAVHNGGLSQCSTTGSAKTYTISSTYLSDSALSVRVDLSAPVSAGVCTEVTERVVVTVSYSSVDLRMYTFTISPTSVSGSGDTVTMSFRIRNDGADAAGSFYISFYYGDSTNTNGLTYLNSFYISSLAGNSTSSTRIIHFTVPANAVYGTRYIHHYVDYQKSIYEYDETNNRGYRSLTVVGRPNLQFTSFVRSPSSQEPGGAVTVNTTIRNTGSTAISSIFDTRFYYSTDTTITTSDTYLNENISISSLNAGASYSVERMVTLPVSATAGTKYIGAITDYNNSITESNENDNTHYAGLTVVSNPDLVIDYFLIVPTTALGYGDQVTAAFRVQNDGNADAGPSTVRFYYGDSTDTAELTPLSSVDVTGLAAGVTSGDNTVDLTLPDNVLYGSRYIHCFIDADGAVTERDESNNRGYRSITVTGRPDLQVDQLQLDSSEEDPGGPVSVSYRLYNAGYSRVPDPFEAAVLFSDDDSFNARDIELKTNSFKPIAAGSYYPEPGSFVTVSTNVPSEAVMGTYYFGVYADWTGTVRETAEDNNTLGAAISVPNTSPEAEADIYSVRFGETLEVEVPGVLANDKDHDGHTLSALLVSEPENGLLTLNADGSFTYTPDEEFIGTDSFIYNANDTYSGSNNTEVTLKVRKALSPGLLLLLLDDE